MLQEPGIQERYGKAAGAVAFVAVSDPETGGESIGTAFHIGNGIFVTARHVVEGKTISEIATTKHSRNLIGSYVPREDKLSFSMPRRLTLIDGPKYPVDKSVDLAFFKVDVSGTELPHLVMASLDEHYIDDNTCLLERVLIIGYPPIPLTTMPVQLAAAAEVNAVTNLRVSKHTHFIVSAMARGGYSGGPVLDRFGRVIGVVTDSLIKDFNAVETGYMAVLNISSVIEELRNHFDYDFLENDVCLDFGGLIDIKLMLPGYQARELNGFAVDARINVYDNDPDTCAEIQCVDRALMTKAVEEFITHAGGEVVEEISNDVCCAIEVYASPGVLKEAALKAKDVFVGHGYVELSTKEEFWQFNNG